MREVLAVLYFLMSVVMYLVAVFGLVLARGKIDGVVIVFSFIEAITVAFGLMTVFYWANENRRQQMWIKEFCRNGARFKSGGGRISEGK